MSDTEKAWEVYETAYDYAVSAYQAERAAVAAVYEAGRLAALDEAEEKIEELQLYNNTGDPEDIEYINALHIILKTIQNMRGSN